MTKKEFIKTFTKEELIEMLFSCYDFKLMAKSICRQLFEKKSNELLDEMDAIDYKKGESIVSFMAKHKKMENIDKKLERLNENFTGLNLFKEIKEH